MTENRSKPKSILHQNLKGNQIHTENFTLFLNTNSKLCHLFVCLFLYLNKYYCEKHLMKNLLMLILIMEERLTNIYVYYCCRNSKDSTHEEQLFIFICFFFTQLK